MKDSTGLIVRRKKRMAMAEASSRRFRQLLGLMAGDERKRFITGSVVVPLLITIITISVGARVASNYQDRQDRRARSRDIIDGLREATTKLSTNLETLAEQGGAVERIRSQQMVLGEIRAVDESISHLKGLSIVLTRNPAVAAGPGIQSALASQMERCSQQVDIYAECLKRALSNSARTEGE